MDVAGVREALRREPFEPFLIRLADGRSLEVKHPEFVALSPRRIIVIEDDDVGVLVRDRAVTDRCSRLPRRRQQASKRHAEEETAGIGPAG
jgi:hypothetical protein